MRGLWKAAFLLAPALVSAFVVPDVWEENEPQVDTDFGRKDIAGVDVATFSGFVLSPDTGDAKQLEYRFQVLPAADICQLGRVLLNGNEIPGERIDDDLVGQGSLEVDEHVVEASWRFECVISDEGLALAQLMTFIPKSIDGTPIPDVKYQVWFDNFVRSTIVQDIPIEIEEGDDMELDLDAEIAELERLRDAADYLHALIREKERALAQFRDEDFSELHKCHSLRCVAKVLFHKAKHAAHRIVWKIKHHHKHGHPHWRPHGNHTHKNCTHKFPWKGNHTHKFPWKGNHTHKFPWKGNHTHPPHFRPPPFCHCRPPPHGKPGKPPGPPHKKPKFPFPKPPPDGPPSFDIPPEFDFGDPSPLPPPMGKLPPLRSHPAGARAHRRPPILFIALHVAKYVVAGVLLSFIAAVVRRRCCNSSRRAEKQARREERHRRRAFRRAAKKQAWKQWFASLVAKRNEEEEEKRAMLSGDHDAVGDEIRQIRNAVCVVGDIVAAEEGRGRLSIGSLPEYGSELGEDLPSYQDRDGSEASSYVADGFGYTPGSSEYVASPALSNAGSVRNVLGDTKD